MGKCLMGWKDIKSVPLGKSVLLWESGDIYKGKLLEICDGENIWYISCGQPVCYPPEPTHWTENPFEDPE